MYLWDGVEGHRHNLSVEVHRNGPANHVPSPQWTTVSHCRKHFNPTNEPNAIIAILGYMFIVLSVGEGGRGCGWGVGDLLHLTVLTCSASSGGWAEICRHM